MSSDRERGIALLVVLCLIALLVIGATSFILISSSEIKMVRRQNDSTQAFYLAEAGLQRARYVLGQDSDWSNGVEINSVTYGPNINAFYTIYDSISLGNGSYSVELENIEDPDNPGVSKDDEIWIKSKGTYDNGVRTVLAKMRAVGNFGGLPITSAVEAEGSINVIGHATVTGDIRDNINSTIASEVTTGSNTISVADATDFEVNDTILIDQGTGQEETSKITAIDGTTLTLESGVSYDHSIGATVDRILSFEDIFGMTKAEAEAIAQAYSPDETKYYTTAFSSTTDVATGLTWVSAPVGSESQISQEYWTGSGVFVVEGDLRITGGTYNGLIWVMGTLFISGEADVFGAIFAESGVEGDNTVTGNAAITYSASVVDDSFNILNAIPSIVDWREVP